ncbi:MAG: hypothetical protein BJ554DRAFT_5250, partial [Olpidium bornovanus]
MVGFSRREVFVLQAITGASLQCLTLALFAVCNSDAACDALMPPGLNGTCYRGGLTVNTNYQQCDVT